MMTSIQLLDLDNLKSALEERLIACERELKTCPPGFLTCRSVCGRKQYIQIIRCDGKVIQRGISKDEKAVHALVNKRFLLEERKALIWNLQVVDSMDGDFRSLSFDDLAARLPKSFSGLNVAGIVNGYDGTDLEWMCEDYEKDMKHADKNVIPTVLGFRVKSKIERDIVETIVDEQLPIRYEQVIYIEGNKVAPDFTIRKKNGELMYWEHFGRMDDPQYRQDWLWKMDHFEQAGIYPGENLITTFEGKRSFLSTEEIRAIINSRLK